MPRIGLLGSLVWDQIHGRDPGAPPVEEWGGIAYALAGLDASVPPGWEIVPLIKVGHDLAGQARDFLRGLDHLAAGARCVEVPVPNNRVVLHYRSSERRTERMSGGVPGWTWAELGPMVRDLDALYVNFISGFELALGTAQALRRGFDGPIYADLHSLLLGMQHDGIRVPQGLPQAADWLACFDVVQVNEDEMRLLSPDPLALAADAMGAGVSLLIVTLGPKGAAYFANSGFAGFPSGWHRSGSLGASRPAGPLSLQRSALIPAPAVEMLDPTGCGDVFGAAAAARLFAGDPVEEALRHATGMASRNAAFRGAGGLARHLRGQLVTP
ncbi:MAG TPA: carbohydrate kinase family protein [Gemmatimonadales bacterium]|nr:carbohydrate kinase family protein [Gemmatimonadales bacterium]